LGVPEADRWHLRPWSAAIVAMYELSHTREQEQKAVQASIEFWDYLKWLVDQRRSRPQDDLISALAAVTDAESGARLSEAELIATCILLLNAGHEATVNGFGNGMFALFCHPQQLAHLQDNPTEELVKTCVEEMLRYDTPLQLFKRWVREDMEYKGVQFQHGQQLVLLFGSANRDPHRFEGADKMDITRQDNPHISFGAGIHFCLGAPLARLELNVALRTLMKRAPRLKLASEPQRRSSYVIRGLRDLKVFV
jgi:cytochrome P450